MWVYFNVQSAILVISGRNTIYVIISQSLFIVPDILESLFGEVLDEMKWNELEREGERERVFRCIFLNNRADVVKNIFNFTRMV